MKFPPKLNPGDTVGIVAPSAPIPTEKIAEGAAAIRRLGYEPKLSDNLDKSYKGLMAGTGKERGDWVNRMFADPEVKAVFCAGGGDGTSRVMEYLDYDLIASHPKIFTGYSDITNLLLGITQRCGFVTFHAPVMYSNMTDHFDDETIASFLGAINADSDFEFKNPKGFDIGVIKAGKTGTARGPLIGGNLSLLSASIGTPYEVDPTDGILYIEEVREPVSKIEKWTCHLRNAGVIAKAKGIILGPFTDMTTDCDPDFDSVACIADICSSLDVPIMFNIQSGHNRPMMTLPMGAECEMDTNKKTIRFKVER